MKSAFYLLVSKNFAPLMYLESIDNLYKWENACQIPYEGPVKISAVRNRVELLKNSGDYWTEVY